ncbi:unnamed protein product [Sphagnum jensenii]|uniref:DUF3846 domain-containing protein n=1 Tax=Sphagnum jensenii TaxID=128206 RepID=A0ABP0VAT0_9BRYO
MKALVIPANPKLTFSIEEGEDGGKVIKAGIGGGWLEMVPLPTEDVILWCDEEGKLKRLPVNARAQELWLALWGKSSFNDVLVGDVVLTGGTDEEGNPMDVPESVIKAMEYLPQ